MKIQDLKKWFGHAPELFFNQIEKSPQAFSNYATGGKGVESKFHRDVANALLLNLESGIFFEDAFDHPNGDDPEHPCYWLNLALDALNEAAKRGADVNNIQSIIRAYGETLLSELPPELIEEHDKDNQ